MSIAGILFTLLIAPLAQQRQFHAPPAWWTAPWPDSPKEFVDARAAIDVVRKKGQKETIAYYLDKKRLLDQGDTSPLLVFEATYTLSFAWTYEHFREDTTRLYHLYEKKGFPLHKEIARTRFLYQAVQLHKSGMEGVAKRMLTEFKDDPVVEYEVARTLSYSSDIQDNYTSYDILTKFLKSKPESPYYNAAMGGTCFAIYLKTNDKHYGRQSKACYGAYLKYADKSDPWYKDGQYFYKRVSDLLDKQ
ncbi:MAG TPA: hypothetical protein VNI20_13200 [Fimbriimonadaceae bacterium]|nr:hypothetical protein [Fimbriimonadaceae bacterium]